MASSFARGIAAQAWCTERTSNKEMDVELAEAFADILDKYIDALSWCGGSADFGPDGKARNGWLKVAGPLLCVQSERAA